MRHQHPSYRPALEALETRELLSTTSLVSELFNTTAPGQIPVGWSQWTNRGAPAFSVTEAAGNAAEHQFTSASDQINHSARAWFNQAQPADVQISADIYVGKGVQGQLLARGQNLNGWSPSFYALTVTAGLRVQLWRWKDGSYVQIAAFQSYAYFKENWVNATFRLEGNQLKAQLFRQDTGQYLNTLGEWQDDPVWVLEVTDSALPGGGLVGVGSSVGTPELVRFDNFHVLTLGGDTDPPQLQFATLPTDKIVSASTIKVQVQDNIGIARVQFLVDGQVRAVDTTPDYSWDLNPATLNNGSHDLTVVAWDIAGNRSAVHATVTTEEPHALAPLNLLQHADYITLLQLAYGNRALQPQELTLLAQNIDLLVSGSQRVDSLRLAAPGTPQLLYTNVSNIYQDLLLAWLNYASQQGISREDAFYHVSTGTHYSLPSSGGSTQPVNWLWGVYRGIGSRFYDVTWDSRKIEGSVAFTGKGDALYMAYSEKFRELNFDLIKGADQEWSGVLEYVAAVDAQGNPTLWKSLSRLGDDTRGYTRSGRMWWTPPADWVPASVNGSAPMYYVRIRALTGTAPQGPVARTILGRDYVCAQGTSSWTVPAFDYAADKDHDGYLNEQEWAARARGKDARFVYESRAFAAQYGQMRFATNPSNPNYRAWVVQYFGDLLAKQPLGSGLFIDNSPGLPLLGNVKVLESLNTYTQDYASLLGALARSSPGRWIMANTVGGGSAADVVASQVQAIYQEWTIRALSHDYMAFESVAQMVKAREMLMSPGSLIVLDAHPSGGSITDSRTQLATLAYYYLLADPQGTALNLWGGYDPDGILTSHWFAAVGFNVGRPLGEFDLAWYGTDPTDSAYQYRVYERDYENALVLYKPLSSNRGIKGGTGDATATTHQLNGQYRLLQADGTLSAPVTSVTLRNGEGAILVKVT